MQAFVNQNEDEYDMENEEEEVDMNDFGTQDHEILVVVVWKSQLLRLLLHFYRSSPDIIPNWKSCHHIYVCTVSTFQKENKGLSSFVKRKCQTAIHPHHLGTVYILKKDFQIGVISGSHYAAKRQNRCI